MKTWWRNLHRDKQLVAMLILVALVACVYCLYQVSQVEKKVEQMDVLSDQMRILNQLRARLPSKATPREQLQEHLRQSAQMHRIPIISLTESEEGVQGKLSAVEFERLLLWLASLQQEQGIRVLILTVERGEQVSGMVEVSQLLVAAQPTM